MQPKSVLILVNNDLVIYNFRKELVYRLIEEGFQVYISSPEGKRLLPLIEKGAIHMNTKVNRHGTNPFQDFKLYRTYNKIIKKVKPDVVLTYTIKPNIYGGLAANKNKVPYIANITGLGKGIENKGFIQKILIRLYKKSFKNINHLYFQNKSNMDWFIDNVYEPKSYSLLPGSGVNIEEFVPLDYPKNKKIIITYLGRIMEDKGICDLIDSLDQINLNKVEIHLTGLFDDNSIKDKVHHYANQGKIIYNDSVNNIIPTLKNSDAVINPSHHEGMSNILLEAAASARPVIATNIPGCREIFDDGVSGLSFEPKNSYSLAQAVNSFALLSFEERKLMGLRGRAKIEKEFNRNIVINKYIKKINSITKGD